MSRGRLLLIEDDAALRGLLQQELALAGYELDVAATGGEGLTLALDGGYDLVILDLTLPDIDGLEVSQRLWDDDDVDADIVMLTARGDVTNRVAGLYAGASDYITKPFDVRELLARIHVRLRERAGGGDELRNGELVLDLASSTVRHGPHEVVLPERECEILRLLLAHPGKLFSRADLERRLYGSEIPASNTIEVFVYGLRRKLEGIGVPELIRTVRHKGYMIT